MGSAQAKEVENNYLKAQNKLLLNNNLENAVDPSVRRQINRVKTTKTYQNLVLSGGSIKGLAHIGVLEKLKELGILTNINQIACSSVGSIVGSLLAVGYKPAQLRKIIMNLDTEKLADAKRGLITELYEIVANHGISSGGHLVEFMGNLIKKQTGNADYTLGQLYEDKGISLVITGTDLNSKKTVYFWHQSNPTLPIRHAVRMSTSIPYLFQPVIFKNSNNYKHFIVDGGLLDDCPEHVFDGEFPGDPMSCMNMVKPNPHTLAIDILGTMDNVEPSIRDISSAEKYGAALINTLYVGNEKRHMRPCYWMRTIPVYTPSYPLTKFNLTSTDKEMLFELGYKSCAKFFEP